MTLVTNETGLTEGERQRDAVITRLDSGERKQFLRQTRVVLVTVALESGEATIDDFGALLQLPPGISPRSPGALPGPLVAVGIIEFAGYRSTSRPEAHARHVRATIES